MRALHDFLGGWALTRRIVHDDGTVAAFEGVATWQDAGDGTAWQVERGMLTLPGQGSFTAERRYLWRGLDVFFEDGRFFHTVPPGGGSARHRCDPDAYAVAYEFGTWPDWHATWRVDGPRKAYAMISTYRRSAASPSGASP